MFKKAVKYEAKEIPRGIFRFLPLSTKFWLLCGKKKGCWQWQGNKCGGYGVLKGGGNGKRHWAHRLSYELNCGPIPEGMLVLHHCDNPACTNWDHLYLGTQAENAADRVARNREGDRRAEKNGRAKLTKAAVEEIRATWAASRVTKVSLAARYGVTDVQIGKVIRGEAWQ